MGLQVLVRARVHGATVVDEQDPIEGIEVLTLVGDDDDDAVLCPGRERGPGPVDGLPVQAGEGLVDDQDRGAAPASRPSRRWH